MNKQAGTKVKSGGKSLFKRINAFLHLWLGLISGAIIVIISVTGCIYVFEQEIRSVTQGYQFVEPQSKPYLPPSQLKAIAAKYALGNKPDTGASRILSVQYGGSNNMAAFASYSTKGKGFVSIYMNPYTGEVLHEKEFNKDFFRFILNGHFYLWLPPAIGQPVVAWSVLIFVIMLISGIIMWWPKNLKKANSDKSFKIKWKAKFKRINYDLHNVLGFYVWLIAMVIALTGLVWGFKWFAGSVYWVTSGGKSLPAKREKVFSDTTHIIAFQYGAQEDKVWQQLRNEYGSESGSLSISFPDKATDIISTIFNTGEGTFYKRQMRRFDRYTLAEIKSPSGRPVKFEDAIVADKLNRLNYDIHVGAVLGLPGKILAFFASFICASLPITGFMIWLGKKKKQKKSTPALVLQRKRVLELEASV